MPPTPMPPTPMPPTPMPPTPMPPTPMPPTLASTASWPRSGRMEVNPVPGRRERPPPGRPQSPMTRKDPDLDVANDWSVDAGAQGIAVHRHTWPGRAPMVGVEHRPRAWRHMARVRAHRPIRRAQRRSPRCVRCEHPCPLRSSPACSAEPTAGAAAAQADDQISYTSQPDRVAVFLNNVAYARDSVTLPGGVDVRMVLPAERLRGHARPARERRARGELPPRLPDGPAGHQVAERHRQRAARDHAGVPPRRRQLAAHLRHVARRRRRTRRSTSTSSPRSADSSLRPRRRGDAAGRRHTSTSPAPSRPAPSCQPTRAGRLRRWRTSAAVAVPAGQVDIQHVYDIGTLTAEPGDTIYAQLVGQHAAGPPAAHLERPDRPAGHGHLQGHERQRPALRRGRRAQLPGRALHRQRLHRAHAGGQRGQRHRGAPPGRARQARGDPARPSPWAASTTATRSS